MSLWWGQLSGKSPLTAAWSYLRTDEIGSSPIEIRLFPVGHSNLSFTELELFAFSCLISSASNTIDWAELIAILFFYSGRDIPGIGPKNHTVLGWGYFSQSWLIIAICKPSMDDPKTKITRLVIFQPTWSRMNKLGFSIVFFLVYNQSFFFLDHHWYDWTVDRVPMGIGSLGNLWPRLRRQNLNSWNFPDEKPLDMCAIVQKVGHKGNRPIDLSGEALDCRIPGLTRIHVLRKERRLKHHVGFLWATHLYFSLLLPLIFSRTTWVSICLSLTGNLTHPQLLPHQGFLPEALPV